MQFFYGFQNVVLTALGVAALGCELFALVDALRHPQGAFVAAGKRTRTFWLLLTGAGTAVGVVTMFSPLNLFALLGFMAAAVYLADVRPALRQVRGLHRRSDSGGW